MVPPETEPADVTYEYAPTTSEIPPPYAFALLKKLEEVTPVLVTDALQFSITLLLMSIRTFSTNTHVSLKLYFGPTFQAPAYTDRHPP